MKLSKNTPANLNIIIPNAGIGKRMKSYGPKCLIDLGSYKCLLKHQLKTIQSIYPKTNIYVIAGFEKDKIHEFVSTWEMSEKTLGSPTIKVLDNNKYNTTTYNESINLAIKSIKGNKTLIIMGDLLFNQETLKYLDFSSSFIVYDSECKIKKREVGVNIINGYATYFAYGLTKKWAQIVYLKGKELELFKKLIKNRVFTFETLNEVMKSGGEFKAIEPSFMQIYEVDTLKDIEEVRKGLYI